jgi:hypothetical protein
VYWILGAFLWARPHFFQLFWIVEDAPVTQPRELETGSALASVLTLLSVSKLLTSTCWFNNYAPPTLTIDNTEPNKLKQSVQVIERFIKVLQLQSLQTVEYICHEHVTEEFALICLTELLYRPWTLTAWDLGILILQVLSTRWHRFGVDSSQLT